MKKLVPFGLLAASALGFVAALRWARGRGGDRLAGAAAAKPSFAPRTLCIDALGLQTDLPIPRYALVRAENVVGIAKDGADYFAVYPLIPGLDVVKEQPKAQFAFELPDSGWKAYAVDGDGRHMYAVQAPLPFYAFRLDKVSGLPADLGDFVRGLKPVPHCASQDVVYRKEADPLAGWLSSLSPRSREALEDAYAPISAPYRKNVTKKAHIAAPNCSMHILAEATRLMTPGEKNGLAHAAPGGQIGAEAFFELKGGMSEAVFFLLRSYLQPRLEKEFGRTAILAKDGELDGELLEAHGPRPADCAYFDVAARYRE